MRKKLNAEQWGNLWDHYMETESISYHGSAKVVERGDTRVSRISDWDSAYLDFAMCLYDGNFDWMQGNHFPEIYSMFWSNEHNAKGRCYVVLERLEELLDMGYRGIDDLFGSYWKDSPWELGEEIAEYCTEEEQALITDSFKDAYERMLIEAKDRGWQADIHGYNVMLRVTPMRNPVTGRFQKYHEELVIIDPWC